MSATLNQDEQLHRERGGGLSEAARPRSSSWSTRLHLHNNRIEALIDQLYGINRKIMSLDGAMVKLADQARINRQEFIEEYRGYELDPAWLDRDGGEGGRGWQALIER